ncbi:hypothetical protein FOL47_009604 [Perkinsus chesapeaki]|uniref:Uncharacterized protein n=1 Tax=Perkinsus chesapeaki TaxID=330153 RepID=A0A7J6MRH3_PERCH|nr:hypothetical protein FOL47_009604 [Perkinsus chesapeaki]
MVSIAPSVAFIAMAAFSMVCDATPTDAKELAHYVAAGTHGERKQISMSMSSKAKNPGKTYVSPWLNVKYPRYSIRQLGLEADADHLDAFRGFEKKSAMETGGAADSSSSLLTRDPEFTSTDKFFSSATFSYWHAA